jgi:hypothetical protein
MKGMAASIHALMAISAIAATATPVTAQLLYPPVSNDHGIMVVGQGVASRPADRAAIDLIVLNYDPYSSPAPESPLFSVQADYPLPNEPQPLTREALQPIIDALVAAGIAASEIEVELGSSSAPYYGDGSATLSFTVEQPSSEQIERLVETATTAIQESEDLYLQETYVKYSVEECQPLETAVYEAAIRDARNRAEAIARAMSVELSPVPSVAESPFNLFAGGCDADSGLSLPFGAGYGAAYYDPSAPAEVQLRRDVFVTFPIAD